MRSLSERFTAPKIPRDSVINIKMKNVKRTVMHNHISHLIRIMCYGAMAGSVTIIIPMYINDKKKKRNSVHRGTLDFKQTPKI